MLYKSAGSLPCYNQHSQICSVTQLQTFCEKFRKQTTGKMDIFLFPRSHFLIPPGQFSKESTCFPKCVGTENLDRSFHTTAGLRPSHLWSNLRIWQMVHVSYKVANTRVRVETELERLSAGSYMKYLKNWILFHTKYYLTCTQYSISHKAVD